MTPRPITLLLIIPQMQPRRPYHPGLSTGKGQSVTIHTGGVRGLLGRGRPAVVAPRALALCTPGGGVQLCTTKSPCPRRHASSGARRAAARARPRSGRGARVLRPGHVPPGIQPLRMSPGAPAAQPCGRVSSDHPWAGAEAGAGAGAGPWAGAAAPPPPRTHHEMDRFAVFWPTPCTNRRPHASIAQIPEPPSINDHACHLYRGVRAAAARASVRKGPGHEHRLHTRVQLDHSYLSCL